MASGVKDSGYAQLTDEQCRAFATKAQRALHFDNYGPAAQRAILARVERLIARNPNSYLARHWKAVYGARTKGRDDDDTW